MKWAEINFGLSPDYVTHYSDCVISEAESSTPYLKRVGQNLYRTASGRYYLLVKRGGKQFRRSLRTTDAALAKRRLREFQDKASRLAGDSGDRAIRFEDLCERWLASRKPELKASSYYRRVVAVRGLGKVFDGTVVRSIGNSEIEKWKSRRGAELSARSWNIELETLKQILEYARNSLRIILDNPAAELTRKKQRKSVVRIPTKDQFRTLVAELRNGHRSTGEAADLVEFMAYSGTRRGEAIEVTWRDVNWSRDSVVITGGLTGTKNHEARSIPLFQPLRRLLESMCQAQGVDKSSAGQLFSINCARLQIVRACQRLRLARFGHHTMRHFFCSNAIEAGCDFKVISDWLGHKDGGVLVAQTYGHLRNEHSTAMAKLITFDSEGGD